MIFEMTDRYALLGSPIDHSPSPAMHNAGFAALGIDATYELRPTTLEDVQSAIDELKDRQWTGVNVTTPLKTTLAEHVQLRAAALAAKAVNTIYWDNDIMVGELTDFRGIRDPLQQAGFSGGTEALLIGSGGAARAAALVLHSLGCKIHIAARSPDKAAQLLDALALEGEAIHLQDMDALTNAIAASRVVIQATPVGKQGEAHTLPWERLAPNSFAFEMLYTPRHTPFLDAARSAGATAIEGWQMLLAQGVASFGLWTGQPAPVEVMQQALLAEL